MKPFQNESGNMLNVIASSSNEVKRWPGEVDGPLCGSIKFELSKVFQRLCGKSFALSDLDLASRSERSQTRCLPESISARLSVISSHLSSSLVEERWCTAVLHGV